MSWAGKEVGGGGNLNKQQRGTLFPLSCGVLLTLVDGRLVFGVALDVLGEPLVKLVVGIEQRGHDEVQQGPQLRDSNNIQPSTVLSGSHEHTCASVNTHTYTHCSPQPLCSGWASQ